MYYIRLRYAILYYPHCALLYHTIPSYPMPYYNCTTSYYAILYYIVYYNILRHTMLYYAVQYYSKLCYAMLHCLVLCYAIS